MKFYIKQKVFTLKDKFDIYDENQTLQYQVKGKFVSITNRLELLNSAGDLALRSNRKVLTLLPKYFVYNRENEEVATIKKLFALRPKFNISILNKEFYLEGNLFAHSFEILDRGEPVASIKKKIIAWGDTYEIEIYSNENIELFLFVVIIVDQVIHESKRRY